MVEEKNKDITDSINYAKRIQEALLPLEEDRLQLFPESFILFLPKDIVSGDFFWLTAKSEKKIIAAADCTGHGVPGALMSMIGNAFLNEIVLEKGELSAPGILNQLRTKIIQSLKQKGGMGESRDGMDIGLLVFDEQKKQVEFAGANNPLFFLRQNEITEIKGDRQPVGFQDGNSTPFSGTVIHYTNGDTFYLLSDGFADQFGGQQGKKFKIRQLKEFIQEIKDKSMPEQERLLREKFVTWKGNLPQVDDVLIIGVRT